jgi:hypothetical protein
VAQHRTQSHPGTITGLQRDICTIHNSIIYDNQEVETTQCLSLDEWMGKYSQNTQWNIIQPYKGNKFIIEPDEP